MKIKSVLVLVFELSILVLIPTFVFALSASCFVLNNHLLTYMGIEFVAPDRFIMVISVLAGALSFPITLVSLANPTPSKDTK